MCQQQFTVPNDQARLTEEMVLAGTKTLIFEYLNTKFWGQGTGRY
jgi:hypothetical protein